MRKTTKILATVLCACMALGGFAACGGNPDTAGRTMIDFWTQSNSANAVAYKELVDTYNAGQGKTDGVCVVPNYNAGDATMANALATSAAPNVVNIADKQIKQFAGLGYVLELDEYMTDEAKETMKWSEIPDTLKYRFMYKNEVDSTLGKKTAGKGTPIVALPNGRIASFIFYNKDILARHGINIVSVAESDLDAYNAANGTSLKPHGYAEYKIDPVGNLTASENKDTGATVYKVLNNRIAMNWEEFRYICTYIKKHDAQVDYAYALEYWFDYAWSIGGDVIGWDSEKGEYVFTLDDKTANYLVLKDGVTLNNNTYNKGDVVRYEDRSMIAADEIGDDKTFHALPSTYDAFLEFSRLGVGSEVTVDSVDGVDYKGYGIACVDRSNRDQYFRAGKSPFQYGAITNISIYSDGGMNGKFDATLMYQWREYVGGSLTGDGKLKVIGETYDGEAYTGDLATSASGVALKGDNCVTGDNYGVMLAKNADSSEYEASFKFASWVAGSEGQKILAKGNTIVPNQSSVAFSDEYLNPADRKFNNAWAAAYAGENSDIGDWAYFNEGSWVTRWANVLNNNVRFGKMTLSTFFAQCKVTANTDLAKMDLRLYRR